MIDAVEASSVATASRSKELPCVARAECLGRTVEAASVVAGPRRLRIRDAVSRGSLTDKGSTEPASTSAVSASSRPKVACGWAAPSDETSTAAEANSPAAKETTKTLRAFVAGMQIRQRDATDCSP